MQTRLFAVAGIVGCLFTFVPRDFAMAGDEPAADEVVDALEHITGVHQGLRRNHSKGTCAVGRFVAAPAARELSASALFSGEEVPLVARFSLAGPNPAAPDTARNPRGLALQFRLPHGELHQMAMLNTPVFGAATVRSFYERQLADIPDPTTGKSDPEKLKAYVAGHPDNRGQTDWLKSHNPPPSFTQATYHSINAFKFIDAGKREHWVKWRFEPRDGVAFLSDADMQTLPTDFLVERLTERARKAPIQWDMIIVLGESGDPLDNPSIAWPEGRREVKAGVLTLVAAGLDATGQCEDVNFDPNVLSTGVEPSPDAVLAFRSSAYAVSFGRRSEEK